MHKPPFYVAQDLIYRTVFVEVLVAKTLRLVDLVIPVVDIDLSFWFVDGFYVVVCCFGNFETWNPTLSV